MKKNTSKETLLVLSVVILFCVCFIYALRFWHGTTEDEQRKSREHLTSVTAKLDAGMTKNEVYEVFDSENWTSISEHGEEIRLSTIPQPLPTNWIVRLYFKDGKLAAIKYGTADNISERPESAPPDRIFD